MAESGKIVDIELDNTNDFGPIMAVDDEIGELRFLSI